MLAACRQVPFLGSNNSVELSTPPLAMFSPPIARAEPLRRATPWKSHREDCRLPAVAQWRDECKGSFREQLLGSCTGWRVPATRMKLLLVCKGSGPGRLFH